MTFRLPSVVAAFAVLALGACAHQAPVSAALPVERPANPRAMLYAACAAHAGPATQVGHYVRLTCDGAPAQALFDEAQTFTRSRGRESTDGAATVRRIGAEPWYDACRREEGTPPAYRCFVHLLAPADFLDPARDAASPAPAR